MVGVSRKKPTGTGCILTRKQTYQCAEFLEPEFVSQNLSSLGSLMFSKPLAPRDVETRSFTWLVTSTRVPESARDGRTGAGLFQLQGQKRARVSLNFSLSEQIDPRHSAHFATATFGAGINVVGVRARIVLKTSSLEAPRLLRSIVVAPRTILLCEPHAKARRNPASPIVVSCTVSREVVSEVVSE